ncbi:hypothetical protein F5984_01310 [Rudanella paleaurantiibacter]|uniref:Secreted repeat protein with Y-X4-D motif n=2 Tax=Rudanella paleaurantiibacter TaxID=2614655 RepID=A0A7J5U455_9BACT|nr:hypothetical protein F5984_01310 [Rudanella paleaurantiibacter]
MNRFNCRIANSQSLLTMHFTIPGRSLFLALAVTLSMMACDNDTTEPVGAVDDASVNLTTTALGPVLTGSGGKTLYFFASDVNGTSACTSPQCLTNWVTFYAEPSALQVGTGLNATDFTVINRPDGRLQTAYKGWPLYYFKNDAKAGDVLGDNVGGVWMAAKPNYSILIGNTQLVGHDGKNYVTANTIAYTEGTGSTLYLTDARGMALYAFANDRKNKNNYTRQDFSNNPTWPLFEVPASALGELPSSLKKADFGSITVFGRNQLTYKGWPLYYFGGDGTTRGATKGVSFPRPNVWPIVNASTPEAPI